MATSILSYTKHGVAESSDLMATVAGHILNLQAPEDIDNGSFATVGDMVDGEIDEFVAVKPDGTKPVFLILTSPEVYADFTTKAQEESNFYNASGDTMRAYELHANDRFALSAEAFADGAEPAVGKYLDFSTGWKAGVTDTAPTAGTVAKIYAIAANGNYRVYVEKNI